MQLLQWSKEIETGLDNVDTQHKQLIGMINQLSIAVEFGQPNSEMLPLVDRLYEYALNHFSVESDIFTHYEYPDRIDHEDEHAAFIDKVKYIRRQCELLDTPMSAKIREFLLQWFISHIKYKDMEYKRFIDTVTHR
jgi:hemerythrin-like metal-binding protein